MAAAINALLADLTRPSVRTTAMAILGISIGMAFLVALMIGLMSIALFSARARRFFKSESSVRRLNRGAGSIMGAAGVYLVSRN